MKYGIIKSQKRKLWALTNARKSALFIARDLLGKVLVRQYRGRIFTGIITETEAYIGPHDLASHSARGRTPRTAIMFGSPGYWYVYFTYGMHWMLNLVTGEKDHAAAVLIRGLDVISGPARLTKQFKIDKSLNGKKAIKANGLWIEDWGIKIPHGAIKRSARIGVAYAGPIWAPKPYRFYLNEDRINSLFDRKIEVR